MCKTTDYQYSCGHVTSFRLSTCSGTFLYRASRGEHQRQVRCHSEAQVTIHSTQACGLCQRRSAQQELERINNSKTRRRMIMNTGLNPRAEAREELDDRNAYKTGKERIPRDFPDGSSKYLPVPDWLGAEYRARERESTGQRALSPLCASFKPEDMGDDNKDDE